CHDRLQGRQGPSDDQGAEGSALLRGPSGSPRSSLAPRWQAACFHPARPGRLTRGSDGPPGDLHPVARRPAPAAPADGADAATPAMSAGSMVGSPTSPNGAVTVRWARTDSIQA